VATYTTLEFGKALTSLAGVPSQVARTVAKRISWDIQANFDLGRDPYRKAWHPLAPSTIKRGRFPPPLTDTRAGRQGVKVKPMQSGGIKLLNSVDYMGFHQKGEGQKRRSFFPDNTLPKKWQSIWDEELTKAVEKKLNGK
jgi:hypothetical protein